MPPSPPETEDRDANLRLNKFPGRNLRSLFPSWKSRPKLSPEERRKILVEILPQGAAWATFVRRFYTLLAISVIIATMGLATDSAAVIIGAMLIAPMMTPIMGLGVALVLGWWRHQVRLILFIALGGLFTVGLGFAVMLVYQAPHGRPIPSQVLERTHPGVGDLGVALCAGLAAAYMQVRRETLSALPGVAISVALVPPLASAGVLIYFGEYDLMWGAVLLFVTNASAIVLAASMLFLAMGVKPPIKDKQLSLLAVGERCCDTH
jgi:uncharacterized hydrophobic protein (TIGR00271 family)